MHPDPLDVARAYPDPPGVPAGTGSDGDPAAAETVVHAETARVDSEWVVSGRVRIRRRVVTERRLIEVDVRREVLEVEGDDVDFRDGRLVGVAAHAPSSAAPSAQPPLVLVLREEVPRIVNDVRAYERVVVTSEQVTDAVTVHEVVRREVVDVDVVMPPRTP